MSLWRGGSSTEALELLEEAIGALERGGAADTAAMYRIKLASMLRQLGRLEEAQRWLPEKREMHPVLERQFLEERARFYLASGRLEEAAVDCRELAAIWETESDGTAERAVVESLLAHALLDAGHHEQAETLARHAADILGPRQHPEAAACVTTMALAATKSAETWDGAAQKEALRMISSHPILSEAAKQRLVEAERSRIEQHWLGRRESGFAPETLAEVAG